MDNSSIASQNRINTIKSAVTIPGNASRMATQTMKTKIHNISVTSQNADSRFDGI